MTDPVDLFASVPKGLRPIAPESIDRLARGRNNQVYFYRDTTGTARILKSYNPNPIDGVTRLEREMAFLRLLSENDVDGAPDLLFADTDRNIAIMEHLAGDSPGRDWVEPWAVSAAGAFIERCQELRTSSQAGKVPSASEACFSFAAHAATLEARLEKLEAIEEGSPLHEEARRFHHEFLRPAVEAESARLRSLDGADAELPVAERWLSPSDFGFHNCLVTAPDSLAFLDFEHAGWDDPAKLIIDFSNQPDHPLPRPLADAFLSRVKTASPDPGALVERVRILRPSLRLKWSCILLNEFLPSGSTRRKFLGSTEWHETETEKKRQLDLARDLLRRANKKL